MVSPELSREELTDPEFTTNRMKFTGHERDPETGLDYMLARYYTSGSGRFLQVDPFDVAIAFDSAKTKEERQKVQEMLENPMIWNKYAYCHENPLAYKDKDGRSAILVTIGIVVTGFWLHSKLERFKARVRAKQHAIDAAWAFIDDVYINQDTDQMAAAHDAMKLINDLEVSKWKDGGDTAGELLAGVYKTIIMAALGVGGGPGAVRSTFQTMGQIDTGITALQTVIAELSTSPKIRNRKLARRLMDFLIELENYKRDKEEEKRKRELKEEMRKSW